MTSMLLLITTMLLLMALTGCSAKKCPKQQYPELQAIDYIPKTNIVVKNGMLDSNGTLKAFKTIKALRVSEHYYYSLITDYRKEFIK